MQPSNTQKRMFDRLNKTLGTESKITLIQQQEKSRSTVLKKIVTYIAIHSAFPLSNQK